MSETKTAKTASVANYGMPWRVQAGDGEYLVIDRYGTTVLHCKARGIAEFVVSAPELLDGCYAAETAFLTGQPRVVGDDTTYPLDGATVGNALAKVRAGIAKAEGRT